VKDGFESVFAFMAELNRFACDRASIGPTPPALERTKVGSMVDVPKRFAQALIISLNSDN
jgi:hypothetical protein